MGYDAYVRCNCLRDGLVKPPPCAVVWNEDGGEYVPEPTLNDPDHELYWQVADWQETACAHKHMRLVDERLGNIAAMGELRAAMQAVGPEYVPTLARVLPKANGGHVSLEENPSVLQDLNRFQTLVEGLPLVVLKDGDTGQELYSTFPSSEMVFVYSPDGELGLDEEGFFVRQGGKITFRGTRVRQHLAPGRRPLHFENLMTGEILERAPTLDSGLQTPALLVVDSAYVRSSQYAEMIDMLRNLFNTSTAVGNPVYWT